MLQLFGQITLTKNWISDLSRHKAVLQRPVGIALKFSVKLCFSFPGLFCHYELGGGGGCGIEAIKEHANRKFLESIAPTNYRLGRWCFSRTARCMFKLRGLKHWGGGEAKHAKN